MPLTAVVRQSLLIGTLIVIVTVLLIVAIVVLTRPKFEKNNYERKSEGLVVYHPYVVSLTTESNTNKQINFACNGVILSTDWVLVGGDCVEAESEWTNLQIRAGSIFWDKDGTTHKVKEYYQSNYGALTALKIVPSLGFNEYIDKVTMVNTSVDWKMAYTVGWYTEKTRLNKKCLIEMWRNNPCVNTDHKLGQIKDNASWKIKTRGAALISKRRVLIGFHVGLSKVDQEKFKHIFLDLQEGYYAQWVRNIVENNKDSIVVKTLLRNITICSYLDVYACQPLLPGTLINRATKDYLTVVSTKFDKDIPTSELDAMQKHIYLKPKASDVLNIARHVSTKKVSPETTKLFDTTIKTSNTLTTPLITLAPTTAPITTVLPKIVPITTKSPTRIMTITRTPLKVAPKTITQTTEETIWDNLPFEESQFYNPV